jgi:hypothetical protein
MKYKSNQVLDIFTAVFIAIGMFLLFCFEFNLF